MKPISCRALLAGLAVASLGLLPARPAVAQNITRVEYFVDADPGIGNATAAPITPAANLSNVAFSVNLSALSEGFHRLSTRSRDANGNWSLTNVRHFFYYPTPEVPAPAPGNITRVEYFIDTDPGFGAATAVPFTPAPNVAGLTFTYDATALTNGRHRLFIRSRDAAGNWSLVHNRSFVKNGCGSSTNLAAGLAASAYTTNSSSGDAAAQTVFNSDNATANTLYAPTGTTVQADFGAGQTRTVSATQLGFYSFYSGNLTVLSQTSANGTTWTTQNTYTTAVVAGQSYDVTRVFAAPVAGVRAVRLVFNNAAGGYVSVGSIGAYNFDCFLPTLTAFSPTSGAVGTSVTVSGTNLTGATSVRFNGVNAPGFVVNGAGTSVTVNVPTGASTGTVSITTPNGTAVSTGSFTVTVANQAPTALGLSPQNVAENTAGGTAIGNFSTTDPDAGNTFTYALVSGTGSTDNGAFTISAGQLVITASPNFEVKPSYAIRVRTTDQGGLSFEQAFTITVTNVNETPSIATQTRAIPENSANGTAVGAPLTATDPDASTTLTYSITGGNTGGAFSFGSGGQLQVANSAALDFETTPTFSLTVQVSDGSLTNSATITVNLTDVVEGPAAPTISGFSPTSGPVGTSVTVSGTNLTGATSVRFNGTSATASISGNTATGLTVTVPAGATDGPLSVTTAGGTATSTASFDVTPTAPVGLTFTPAAGAPGSVVRITGTGFTAATVARFNGEAATGTRFVSATELIATVPGGASSGTVTATTGATVLTGASFTILGGAAPRLTYFTPLKAPVGTVLTVRGTGFTGVSAVRFGTVNAPGYVVQSATSLTVPVPAGAVSGVRLYVVTGQGMAQSARTFTLILPPTLTSATPAYGAPGALTVLTGTNLTNATTVTFNGEPATDFTVESATRIVASIPAGATSGPVEVTTVAGAASVAFAILAGPAPAITGVTPGSGPIGTTVVISGTGLNGATSVRFNTTEAVGYVVNSASQITASVPAGATTGKVWVLTPRGLTRSATPFTVTTPSAPAPVPTITSFAPGYGSPGALVVITGTNLRTATGVYFGGNVAATSFVANSATQLVATVPAGASTGTLRVTTPAGTATSASAFTITTPAAPAIDGFSPASGPVGQSVTVTGSGFTGVTSVRVNELAASFTVQNTGQLTLTVPAGATSGKISVLASGGLMISATSFTVVLPPTVTALNPTSGAVGAMVTVTGTNLTAVTTVRFGGVVAPAFTVVSATKLTATVPVGALTGPVSVTNAAGTGASPMIFTVVPTPAPTVSSLSPASGIVGTAVTITGTNLTGATSVSFNGKLSENYVVLSATSLVAVVPDGATTGPVSVQTAGGIGTSATPFTVLVAPDIDALTPVRGPVGTVVTLVGTGLGGATSVTFGGVAATVFSSSPDGTSATATVPSGAATGQVSLTTPAATAVSAQVFTLTSLRQDGVAWVSTEPWLLVPYPNPASTDHQLTIQVLNRPALLGSASVYLYDGLGRKVRVASLDVAKSEATFDLVGLAPGVYVARCGTAATRLLVVSSR